ncbi:hypothetical protein LTR94_025484, partial [Friedmanniomyces endolithicus]
MRYLIAALALGIAELVVPGVFLIFLAVAAAITAALLVAVPGVALPVQLLSFAVPLQLAMVAVGAYGPGALHSVRFAVSRLLVAVSLGIL